MGKQFPGEIVSKYNDVNKYEYNATTNPGLLAEGKNLPINNFYNGMYSDASDESGIFVRMGDKGNSYGSIKSDTLIIMEIGIQKFLKIQK